MTRSTSQKIVSRFVKTHRMQAPLESRVLDIVSEVGELAKEVLKGTKYGKKRFTRTLGWGNELGDVYFSLLCLADQTGVNLHRVLNTALTKYRSRLALRGDAASGG